VLPAPVTCRDGYFMAGGVCYPYSWNSGTTPP
jgi:hypothetical protein